MNKSTTITFSSAKTYRGYIFAGGCILDCYASFNVHRVSNVYGYMFNIVVPWHLVINCRDLLDAWLPTGKP